MTSSITGKVCRHSRSSDFEASHKIAVKTSWNIFSFIGHSGQRKKLGDHVGKKILPFGYFWHARCKEYCAMSKDNETVPGF